MNRFARCSIALSAIFAIIASGLSGAAAVEAAPVPLAPTNSIDISTSGLDCAAAPAPPRDQAGFTLSASAKNAGVSISAVTRNANVDRYSQATTTTRSNWTRACDEHASRALNPHAA